jgi:hypothetical protein
MALILDMPMLVPERQQTLRRCSKRVKAGDRVMQCANHQPGGEDDAGVLDAQHLPDILPAILARQVGVERAARAQSIRVQPPVAFDRALASGHGRLSVLACAGKEAAQRAEQPRLVVFDP